jgi:hypothetical protein
MHPLAAALAWAGAAAAFWRIGVHRQSDPPAGDGTFPMVSILVPACNEEKNLPPLLSSLHRLDYPSYEIILVDDASTDRTAEVARAYGIQALTSQPLPAGWNPKNWACHQGARAARGELLLFTDADTVHRPGGLKRAVRLLRSEHADLVSCLPFHRCPTLWEKMMGPFHALTLVATAHRSPLPGRLFAVGQFLLFDHAFYKKCGGHASVAAQYPDDLALANLCFAKAGTFRVFSGDPFFEVRMYATFADFVRGWRRNFQAGLRQGRAVAAVEVALVVAALLAAGRPMDGWPTLAPAALILALMLFRQGAWGAFSPLGILLYPFALLTHMAATSLALWDWARGGAIQWKERELTGWAEPRA